MKLQDAIILGRFCGLQSVKECYLNIHFHYWNTLPLDEVEKEKTELDRELAEFECETLELDWNYIDQEVKKQEKEFSDYCDSHSSPLLQGLDDDILEDWRKG